MESIAHILFAHSLQRRFFNFTDEIDQIGRQDANVGLLVSRVLRQDRIPQDALLTLEHTLSGINANSRDP